MKLARDKCFIEAIEPDLATIGLIDGIREITRRRRRRGLISVAFAACLAFPVTIHSYLLYLGTNTPGGITVFMRQKGSPGMPGPVEAVLLVLVLTAGSCFFPSRKTLL